MFCKDCSLESCSRQCRRGSTQREWLLKAEICLPGSRGERGLDSRPMGSHLAPQAESLKCSRVSPTYSTSPWP